MNRRNILKLIGMALLFLALLFCFSSVAFADVNKKDGVSIVPASNQDGFTANIAKVNGQTIAAGGGGGGCTTVHQEIFGSTDIFLESGPSLYVAVHFWASNTTAICKISIYAEKEGTPTGNCHISVYNNGGDNKPSTIVGSESAAVARSTAPAAASPNWWDFTVNVTGLTANTEYYIVLRTTVADDSVNNVHWLGNSSIGVYPFHQTIYSSNDGTTWSNQGNGARCFFRIYQ